MKRRSFLKNASVATVGATAAVAAPAIAQDKKPISGKWSPLGQKTSRD